MSTTSTTPTFSGTSTYASDLQQVITRAVSVASLPMQLLEGQQSTLSSESSGLETLTTDFANVQSAVTDIGSATGLSSYAPTVSDNSVATASLSTGATQGTWDLNVLGLGSRTNTMSNDTLPSVSDPSQGNISSSSSFTLTVNNTAYAITPSGSSLNDLVSAINSSSAGVQATLVNVGSSSSPNYLLSIQSQNYAPDTIQLNDGTSDLLSTLSTGSAVTYQVNGEPSTPISSNSRTVTLSPGLTASIASAGDTQITVSQNSTSLSNALTSFVTAYNAVVDELNNSRGSSGGALTGNSIVSSLEQGLQNMVSYQSSGTVASISDLGLDFDQEGHLNLDTTALSSAVTTNMSAVSSFLGDGSSSGFLQLATTTLSGILDTTTGILPTTTDSISSQISDLQTKINDDESQVTQLQTNLTSQMSAADTLIASLQSQNTEITDLFKAMQVSQQSNS